MQRYPSNQRPYDMYWSGDPAFAQLADDASEAARAERDRQWDVARDTGDYNALLAEGRALHDAAKYVMQLVPGRVLRKLIDLRTEGKLGAAELAALAFRVALVDVVNFPGLTIKREADAAHPWAGKLLALDVTDQIDAENVRIIGELGMIAYARALGVRPKS